jgi:hypothetical protein
VSWSAVVDAYCERTGPGFWAEPLNAATNAAFLIAAWAAWRGSAGRAAGRGLAAVLALIGVGSFLFHTLATRWAGLADVVPIGVFILCYVWWVNRLVLGLPRGSAAAVTAGYLPLHAALAVPLSALPVVGVSGGYLPVPVAILGYAAVLRRCAPETARGMAVGASILAASILLRSLDMPLCPVLPAGTHSFWHLLNALMLWWMIRVLVRHEGGLRRGPPS